MKDIDLFRNAAYLAELTQKLCLNAEDLPERSNTPKTYAPSRLGVSMPPPNEAATISGPKEASKMIILRVRPFTSTEPRSRRR